MGKHECAKWMVSYVMKKTCWNLVHGLVYLHISQSLMYDTYAIVCFWWSTSPHVMPCLMSCFKLFCVCLKFLSCLVLFYSIWICIAIGPNVMDVRVGLGHECFICNELFWNGGFILCHDMLNGFWLLFDMLEMHT